MPFLPEIVLGIEVIASLLFFLAGNVVHPKLHSLGCKLTTLILPSGVLC